MYLKNKYYLAIFACSLFFLGACSKKNTISPQAQHQPKPYPIGNVIDHTLGYDVVRKQVIGPEGGSLKSMDGDIKINIPAGALTTATEISVEPIANTNPGGVGNGFRLKPHGITFNKEVELSFSYTNIEREPGEIISLTNSSQFLGVAYQDEKQFWRYMPPTEVDEANKRVKVKTKHFSDWTLMQWMYLLPQVTAVKTNEQLELKAVRVLPAATAADGFITPLVPPDGTPLMVGEQVDLEDKYIKKWTLSRNIGKLAAAGHKATYTAPATVPQVNPVAVSLELNMGNHQVLLVSNIEIMTGDIEFRINGGNLITLRNATVLKTGNGYTLSSRDNNNVFALTWKGNGNWMLFNQQNVQDNTFQYVVPDATSMYLHTYNERLQPLLASGGNISIKRVSEHAISGSFVIAEAGHFSIPVGDRIGIATIEGKFSARKVVF